MSWNQEHGTSSNNRVMLVNTELPIERQWTASIGGITLASPVVDENGAVCVGTMDGTVVVFNADGLLRFRSRDFVGSAITSAAAFGPSGEIYVVTTTKDGDAFHSNLHRLSAEGAVQWSLGLPREAWTTAAPTLWTSRSGTFLALLSEQEQSTRVERNQLLIVDEVGDVVANSTFGCPRGAVSGGFNWSGLLGDLVDLAWPDPSDLGVFVDLVDFLSPDFDGSAVLHPSSRNAKVAVVPADGRADEVFVVAVAQGCTVQCYRWDGRSLVPHWGHDFHRRSILTAPSVNRAGQVVIGRANGRVRGFLLPSGLATWTYDAGAPVLAPAAFAISPVYILAGDRLHLLGLNGRLWRDNVTGSVPVSGPLLSRNHLLWSSSRGTEAVDNDLSAGFFNRRAKGGGQSPAVAPDGTVYVVVDDDDGWLLAAYGRSPDLGNDQAVLHAARTDSQRTAQ